MNKILLAITILGTGAGGYFTARQSTISLHGEASTTREAWLAQTQLVNIARNEQSGLIEHVRQLKEALAQAPAVEENALWAVLQTNRIGHLPPELRERLFVELSFNWQSSADYIIVSKETIRDIQMDDHVEGDKLTDIGVIVLAITPEERGLVEAAIQRVRADFLEWESSHIQRSEPNRDVVAQYILPGDPAVSMSFSNNFASAVFDALGRERANLITERFPRLRSERVTMIVKRYKAGTEERLKVRTEDSPRWSVENDLEESPFPEALRPLFPNGWSDLALREGFQLPERAQAK
jgi:hypothetical protein